MGWFLIQDTSNVLNAVYEYFHHYGMFTTNSEFAVNQQLVILHLLYDGERVLIIGRVLPQHVQNTSSTL